jgi:hypothetical protein
MLTPWSAGLTEKLIVALLVKNIPPFMKPKDSLLCSQDGATDPYHELDEFSPQAPTLFLSGPFSPRSSKPLKVAPHFGEDCGSVNIYWQI